MSQKMRTKKLNPDYWLFGATVALLFVGVILVFDASYARAAQMRFTGHDSWFFVKRQLLFATLGMFGLIAAMHFNLSFYRKIAKLTMVISIISLIAVFITGVGDDAGGASRWIGVGPFKVQPSEIAKLAVILYLADVLARQKNRIRYLWRGILRHLLWVGLIALLILKEPDMGTAIVLVGAAFAMFFAAGALKRHLLVLGGLLACGGGLLILFEPYRLARIKAFIDPMRYYYGTGYQIAHGLMALATGGIYGVGLVEGREKFYLPAAHTDYIFATVAEEAGLIGGLILLLLFGIFTYRGFQIARECKSPYGALLATGVTSVIALQTVINIGVVTSLIPATGVPLPFISYGGSSLVFTLILAGVLLSVSRNLNEQMIEDSESDENNTNRRRDRRAYISRTVGRTRVPRERTKVRTVVHR